MEVETIRKRLKDLFESRGLKMRGVSLAAGLGDAGVRNILTGRKEEIGVEALHAILRAIGVSVQEFYGFPGAMRGLPVLGTVPAGHLNLESAGQAAETLTLDFDPHSHFALVVDGDSMEPRFVARDRVICLRVEGVGCGPKQVLPAPLEQFARYDGKVIAALIDNQTTLKKLEVDRKPGGDYVLRLKPFNERYPEIVVQPENTFAVQGEAVGVVRYL